MAAFKASLPRCFLALTAAYCLVTLVSVYVLRLMALPPAPVQLRNASRQSRERPCQSGCLLSTTLWGRLGNQMFQYASLLGIAVTNNRLPLTFFPTDSLLEDVFQLSHVAEWRVDGFLVVQEKAFATYDARFARLPPQHVLAVQFLQSWKYFDDIRDIIQKEFRFLPRIKDSAARLMAKCVRHHRNWTTVGVHVRRGDMVTRKWASRGYNTAPASYFKQAMELMRNKYEKVVFIFVTEDVKWLQENVKFPHAVLADQASPEVHLALLASCDHVIMSVGTFGWWGGYLAGGDVIYYEKEFMPKTLMSSELTPADRYPPYWLGLGDD